VKALTNPIVLRMALAAFAAGFAFLMGLVMIRRMRRSLTEDASPAGEVHPSSESFPLHTYHAVIQQLKQQKHELQSLQLAERKRAKTSENISAAVLSNLSCGVMFVSPNGLIRQVNPAARQILGYASPVGMSTSEIFREAAMVSDSTTSLAEALRTALHDKTLCRWLDAHYLTPGGEQRNLDITVTAVRAPNGDFLGAACLLNDQTEIAEIRRQQQLRGEMSAEMALALRNSLATISGYAQQLAASRDSDLARQLAADIAAEASHLDRTIGGFLAGARAARIAAQV
jgi:PAS domain S-box-containing protein